MKNILLFLSLFCMPVFAQVQLGGHISIPSSSDSIEGRTFVNFTANGNCTILTQTNCSLFYDVAETLPAGVGGMYSGMMIFTDYSSLLTGTVNVYVPDAGGAKITVGNLTGQTINVYGTGGTSFVVVKSNSVVNMIALIGGIGFDVYSGCEGTSGYLLESITTPTTKQCVDSPLDDGISNPGYVTDTKGFVFPYTTNGTYPTKLFIDTPNPNSVSDRNVFISDNIYAVDGSTHIGTLVNNAISSAAISFSLSDSTGGGSGAVCVNYWTADIGVTTLTEVASLCLNSAQFFVPVVGAQPPVTQSANLASTRVLGTVYQNTSALALYVQGDIITSGSVTSQVVCSDGPTSTVSQIWGATYGATVSGGFAGFSCMIPPSYYYSISDTTGVTSLGHWYETTF